MRKFREGKDRQQLTFLPPSIEEYIGEEDPVRLFDNLLEEFDLREIELSYGEVGAPAYSPTLLTKVILYGKLRGIRSCRELSRACRENLLFMYLTRGEKPDFRTINLFRKRFAQELSEILAATVQVAIKEGMVSLDHVAVDGTKIKGYASKKSFIKVADLDLDFSKDIAEDENEDGDEPGIPAELRSAKAQREWAKRAARRFNEMESQGRKIPKQISGTDPECHYLHSPKETSPMYNVQAAVDSKHKIVVAGYASSRGNDNAELPKVLEEIEKNTERNPKQVSADKGYSDVDGLEELKRRNIDGYVSQIERLVKIERKFKYDASSDTYTCPDGRKLLYIRQNVGKQAARVYQSSDCSGCELASTCIRNGGKSGKRTIAINVKGDLFREMSAKMRGEIGKAMATLRSATVEPIFGHLKHARNLVRFFFRGLSRIDSDWKLELASFNIQKIIRFRAQKIALA